ncbi:MAG: 50S ribosomal protein L24 [Bdellovibrionota bacterium]
MNTEKSRFSLRKNDMVQVIAGREKGKTGKLLSVNGKSDRVTIEKVNMVKRHTKPTQGNPHGGMLEKEASIHYSNVLLFCAKCNKGVRHGMKTMEVGASKKGSKKDASEGKMKKIRVCKKCDQSLESA